jgi:hypothetical protein
MLPALAADAKSGQKEDDATWRSLSVPPFGSPKLRKAGDGSLCRANIA